MAFLSVFLLMTLTLFGSVSSFQVSPARRIAKNGNNSLFSRYPPHMRQWSTTEPHSFQPDNDGASSTTISGKFIDYLNVLRPVTILQAVGALIVGHLALSSGMKPLKIIPASLSVYLSYGCGMLMNDLVDVDADSLHNDKQDRAIASGRISTTSGWIYCASLVALSLLLGNIVGGLYAIWVASNLGIMLFYALGLQKVFLLKNILCGWLAVSPLIGASLLTGSSVGTEAIALRKYHKWWSLAAVGFPMQVSREILKDIEDVDIDRGKKMTFPIVIGKRASHWIAYGIITMNISLMVFTPLYWELFASRVPIFPLGVIVSASMCTKAAMIPLKEGQQLVKNSIYVLLAAMIGALSLQQS